MEEVNKNINPFPGIRNFEPDESKLFFGREKLIDELINQLSAKHFLAVIGSSGSGKSSLIRAGVIPRLFGVHNGGNTEWKNLSLFRPGDNPIDNMANSLFYSYDFDTLQKKNISSPESIYNMLSTGGDSLKKFIDEYDDDKSKKKLIVIDQFEELFRYKQNINAANANEEVRKFIDLFLRAIKGLQKSFYVVLIMRSDFIDDCREYLDLFHAIKDGNYLVPRMSDAEIKEAITGPVKYNGKEISPRLIDRLIDDIKDEQDQLPILQHALMRTWDYWFENRSGSNTIDIVHYESIGGIQQALSLHGEEIYNNLPDQRSKDITEKLFKALTELGPDNRGTRRPTSLKEICVLANAKEDEVINVSDHFRERGCAFLMPSRKIPLAPDSILDISHESIMRVWTRLKKWVEEETKSASLYQRLAETAKLYQEGKTGLWVNPELQLALKWQQQSKPNPTWAMRYDPSFERAISFLDYSKKEFEQSVANKENLQKRSLKKAKRIAFILFGASLISILFLIVALELRFEAETSEKEALQAKIIAIQERKKAEKQSKEAVLQKKISEQQQQIAEQQTIITEEQRQFAMQQKKIAETNANEAIKQKKLADDAKDAAENARDEAQLQRKEAIAQKKVAVEQKKIAENERTKAQKSEQNAQRLRFLAIARTMSIQAVKFQRTLKGDLPALLALQAYKFTVNNNGNENDPDIYLALMNVLNETRILRGHQDAVRAVAVAPNGKTISSCSEDGVVRMWINDGKFDKSKKLNTSGYGDEAIRSLAYSPDGKYLAAGAFEGPILVWNISERDPDPIVLKGHSNVVNDIAFAPNAPVFASAGSDGRVYVWDLRRPSVTPVLARKFNSRATAVCFSPDGGKLSCGTDKGALLIFDTKKLNEPALELQPNGKSILSLAYNNSGSKLASGSSDGMVRIWNPRRSSTRPIDLIGHISGVSDLKFSPTDETLATCSYDGTIRLWSYTESQQRPIILSEHDSWVYSIDFSNDGTKLFSAGADKTIRVWTTKSKLLADKICNMVKRNMNSNEWNKYVGSDIEYQRTCK